MNIQDVSVQVYHLQVTQYAMFKTSWLQAYFAPWRRYTCTETCRRYVLKLISAINAVYLIGAINGLHRSKKFTEWTHSTVSVYLLSLSLSLSLSLHWRSAPCMSDSVVVKGYNSTPPNVSYQFAPSVNRATFAFDYLPAPPGVYLILCNRTMTPMRTVPYSWYVTFSRESVQLLYTVL